MAFIAQNKSIFRLPGSGGHSTNTICQGNVRENSCLSGRTRNRPILRQASGIASFRGPQKLPKGGATTELLCPILHWKRRIRVWMTSSKNGGNVHSERFFVWIGGYFLWILSVVWLYYYYLYIYFVLRYEYLDFMEKEGTGVPNKTSIKFDKKQTVIVFKHIVAEY